jgi:hypothetical protein
MVCDGQRLSCRKFHEDKTARLVLSLTPRDWCRREAGGDELGRVLC